MSLDQTLIERSGYTVLDLLSDVGGLQGILIYAISLLLSILNHNHLENYMASKLFREKSSGEGSIALTATDKWGIISFFTEKVLPRKMTCCHQSRRQIALKKARASLIKEVDVLKLIRSRRFVHLALKHLLDPPLRKEFKARSRAKVVGIPQDLSSTDKKIEAKSLPDVTDDRTFEDTS